ncbi:hypothetical protein LTR15_006597 [Elasticomyces elasticus]|nr:hypothetical protein LTR15_006597 [Elasticomyces elasticus]
MQLTDWPATCGSDEMKRALFFDAETLGIPRKAVVLMLYLFVQCVSVRHHPNRSGLEHICRYHTPELLAYKLTIDRDVMFDAVILPQDHVFRQMAAERNKLEAAMYFDHLGSIDDFELRESAPGYEGHGLCSRAFRLPTCVRLRLRYVWVYFVRNNIYDVPDAKALQAQKYVDNSWTRKRQHALFGEPPWPQPCCRLKYHSPAIRDLYRLKSHAEELEIPP